MGVTTKSVTDVCHICHGKYDVRQSHQNAKMWHTYVTCQVWHPFVTQETHQKCGWRQSHLPNCDIRMSRDLQTNLFEDLWYVTFEVWNLFVTFPYCWPCWLSTTAQKVHTATHVTETYTCYRKYTLLQKEWCQPEQLVWKNTFRLWCCQFWWCSIDLLVFNSVKNHFYGDTTTVCVIQCCQIPRHRLTNCWAQAWGWGITGSDIPGMGPPFISLNLLVEFRNWLQKWPGLCDELSKSGLRVWAHQNGPLFFPMVHHF